MRGAFGRLDSPFCPPVISTSIEDSLVAKFGKDKREKDEVNAPRTNAEIAYDHRRRGSSRHACQQDKQKRRSHVKERPGRSVSTQPEEHGVPQRDKSSVSRQDVVTEERNPEDDYPRSQIKVVGIEQAIGGERERQQDRGSGDLEDYTPFVHVTPAAVRWLPNSPAGLMIITTATAT